VGFGREARRVRDTTLPHAYRLHALATCIEMSPPIGFNATWSYLKERIDVSWRSIDFLVPALDLLEAERSERLRLEAQYSAIRHQQKIDGERFSRPEHVTPRSPIRWHGDERLGATYALTAWVRRRDVSGLARHPKGSVVLWVADEARRSMSPAIDAQALQGILDWALRHINVGWQNNSDEYAVASQTLFLLGQVHLMVFSAPTINTPWNFVTST
jgi:hypothetical protein